MVVLGRPRGALHLKRAREPGALRVDLGSVRDQRLVAEPEEVRALYPGGDLQFGAFPGAFRRAFQPLRIGRLQAPLYHPLVQRGEPRLVERSEVVELERLPGIAGTRVTVGVGGGLERLDRDLMSSDVVRVRVPALLVV